MPYVIDGSNLGGVLGGASGARDRVSVVEALLPWVRRRRRVELIFDGPPEPRVGKSYGGLTVTFSGSRTADELIRRRVEGAPASWIVVTADRDLADSCRRLGAKVLSPRQLVAGWTSAVPSSAPGDEENPRVDVEDWEAFFEGRPDPDRE
ncbi:MAG: NYN domain-containing protein [Thermoanaerobaculia bacterium]|nr:NYN domain-containing protein [Thermoanaerobaculia bacterium]